MRHSVTVDELTRLSEEQREGVRRKYGDAVCLPADSHRTRWLVTGFLSYLALGIASFLPLTPAWSSAQNLVAVLAWVLFPGLALSALLLLLAIALLSAETEWLDDHKQVIPLLLHNLAAQGRLRRAVELTSSALFWTFLVTATVAGWLLTSFMLLVCWALSHWLYKSARSMFLARLLPKAIAVWDAQRDFEKYGNLPSQ